MEGFRPVAPKARALGPADREIGGGGRVRPGARTPTPDTHPETVTLWRAGDPMKGFGRSIREGQKPPGAIRPAKRNAMQRP